MTKAPDRSGAFELPQPVVGRIAPPRRIQYSESTQLLIAIYKDLAQKWIFWSSYKSSHLECQTLVVP